MRERVDIHPLFLRLTDLIEASHYWMDHPGDDFNRCGLGQLHGFTQTPLDNVLTLLCGVAHRRISPAM